MTGAGKPLPQRASEWRERLPYPIGGAAFLHVLWEPIVTLRRDWWNDPEAGRGLPGGPLAG